MINYVKGLQRETEDKDGNGPFGFSSQEALLTRAERLSVVLLWQPHHRGLEDEGRGRK